jgi:hypothetical protein
MVEINLPVHTSGDAVSAAEPGASRRPPEDVDGALRLAVTRAVEVGEYELATEILELLRRAHSPDTLT